MSTRSEGSSLPELPAESVGSSVSSSLQKEYEELLRYAVVTPKVVVPQMEKVKKIQQFSTTTTESSSEFYESDIKDVRKEVSGLPSTPLITGTALARGRQPEEELIGSDEKSSEVKESDNSFVSSQSATPDQMMLSDVVSPMVDGDLVRMETQLDSWCLDMKRNILAEFAQCKMALLEKHRQALRAEKQRHAAELNKQQNEMEGLKELLYTYEKTMEHKDHIIGNMTKAIQKQKERFDLLRRFSMWKIKHVEEKKEGFGSNLARKHRNHVLKCKLWSAWRSLVETKWKQKVEKACQSKAQDVCIQLTDEYEGKLQEANKALEEARLEVGRLHAEREIYEETMKKAFMRGVCALNLEAMHMFREPGDEDGAGEPRDPREERASSDSGNEMNPRSHLPKPSVSSGGISNRRVTPNIQQPPSSMQAKTAVNGGNFPIAMATTSGQQTARIVNVKAVGRADFRPGGAKTSAGVAPPGASTVSSILVQRHSGSDAIQSKTIRSNQPSHNPSKLAKPKPGSTVTRTTHAPPVKVVH